MARHLAGVRLVGCTAKFCGGTQEASYGTKQTLFTTIFNLQATAQLVSSPAICIQTAHSVKTCNIYRVVFHNKP